MEKRKPVNETAPVIWCEISCAGCGETMGLPYTGQDTITKIRNASEEWRYTENGNLCPACLEKQKGKTP